MTERRFNEAEVAAIFKEAAEAQHTGQQQLPSGEGMTVAELRAIAGEVGISPQLVEQAAKRFDITETPASRTYLGLPISVARTVELDRKLSEEEWDRLVVDLRETFEARGKLRVEGSLRQWTNGNLQALLEPTPSGHRLRMRTTKGDARGMITGGLIMVGAAALALIGSLVGEGFADPGKLSSLAMLGTGGAAMFGLGAFRLPSWARLRRQQMEEIADRLVGSSRGALPDA